MKKVIRISVHVICIFTLSVLAKASGVFYADIEFKQSYLEKCGQNSETQNFEHLKQRVEKRDSVINYLTRIIDQLK